MKLIIPSAKLISPELQSIGKIPPIIYPINQNISFDFFKLKYDSIVDEIVLIGFEKIDKIREIIANYKLNVPIKIIALDELKDLGYSIYKGLNDDDDVIIHFADTIVMDSLPFDEENFFCASNESMNELWTFYDIDNGQITFINDKKYIQQSIQKNFFTGVFKFNHGSYFKKCLEEVDNKSMDSFYSALMVYSQKYKLNEYLVKDWFDIGHSQKYFESRMQIDARTFNHIEIDKNRGILKKTSKDIEKFIGEIKWYLKLPKDIEYVRPRIFDYSLHFDEPYVSMEYYSYRTLHELYLYGDLTGEQWQKIFRKIKFVLEDFAKYELKSDCLNDSLKQIYFDKTLNRLNKLRIESEFENWFKQSITINGKVYRSLNDVIEILQNIIPKLLYDVDSFKIIHGDFCFTNIMIDDNLNFIKLIDPRGTFGKYDIYGDQRYELAKLLHSIEGKYDYIIKDLFNMEIKSTNEFEFKILESNRKFDLVKVFMNEFKINDDVRLIESLLFLSMIPMHKESINHQYAMLCTGLKLLSEVVKIEE